MIEIEVVYTPHWFFGEELFISLFSLATLALIAFFSMRYYRLSKNNKNYLYLSYSFFVLALSFIFRIVMNFTVLFETTTVRQVGLLTMSYETVHVSNVLYIIGFFVYRLLALSGLYMLYSLAAKQRRSSVHILVTLLLIISTYFSQDSYYVFHFTSLVILGLISYHYYHLYQETKHANTRLLFLGFVIIALSQLLFMVVPFRQFLYIVADGIQLAGYCLLFVALLRIVYHGKKKKQD